MTDRKEAAGNVFYRKGGLFFLLLALCLMILSACSTKLVTSNKINEEGGIVYFLPEVEYDISIERELKDYNETTSELSVFLTPQITTRYIADTTTPYFIKYEKLDVSLKTSSLTVELYSSGSLKSVNGGIEDKTGAFVTNVLTGAAKIAGAFVGFPAMAPLEAIVKAKPILKQDIQTALENVKTLGKEIKGAEDKLAELNKRLQAETDEKKIAELKEEIKKLEQTIEKTNKKIALAKKELVVKETYTFRPLAGKTKEILKGVKAKEKWLEDPKTPNPEIDKVIDVCFSLRISQLLLSVAQNTAPGDYLVYRQPIPAEMIICQGGECLKDDGALADDIKVLLSGTTLVPQFGLIGHLKLDNGPFDNNALKASFDESGALTSFSFSAKSSAEAASASFKDSADIAGKYLEAVQTFEKNSLQRETEQTEGQLKLEIAKKKLKDCLEDPEKCTEKETEEKK